MNVSCILPVICVALLSISGARAGVLPETMDAPEPRPQTADESARKETGETQSGVRPDEEVACRERLRELEVVFSEHDAIDEPEGCVALHPLTVSQLPGGVELRPPAVLTCAMAEATGLFVRDHAAPLAREVFGSDLAAIEQVSSYVCRPRAGTQRLSEHAFANALDWGALELADGALIDVRSHRRAEPRRARLVTSIREAACGPFTTVLGPGSDDDHADHFHFDLAERPNRGVWCE